MAGLFGEHFPELANSASGSRRGRKVLAAVRLSGCFSSFFFFLLGVGAIAASTVVFMVVVVVVDAAQFQERSFNKCLVHGKI